MDYVILCANNLYTIYMLVFLGYWGQVAGEENWIEISNGGLLQTSNWGKDLILLLLSFHVYVAYFGIELISGVAMPVVVLPQAIGIFSL